MTLYARYNRASYLVGALLLTIMSLSANALEVPPLKAHVNDYANMLSATTVNNLESQLAALESSDSTQVVVLTIPSLEGEVLEEFSIKVAEKWKIGQKNLDNGVILLISKADRKIRIEVGRGLEGKLTDLISGRIMRDEITPKFKNGDFDGGVAAGVTAIISVVKGEYQSKSTTGTLLKVILFVVLMIVLIWLVIFFKKIHKKIIGVTIGTIGLPLILYIFSSGQLVMAIFFLPFGFFISISVTVLFGDRRIDWAQQYGIYPSSGSSSSHSSWSTSSSSSSSSYSGGGGSFGGGGASGSW